MATSHPASDNPSPSVDPLELAKERIAAKAPGAAALTTSQWDELFTVLVDVLTKCAKNGSASGRPVVTAMKHPTRLQQLLLREAMVKRLGRTEFKKIGGADIYAAFVAAAHEATESELQALQAYIQAK